MSVAKVFTIIMGRIWEFGFLKKEGPSFELNLKTVECILELCENATTEAIVVPLCQSYNYVNSPRDRRIMFRRCCCHFNNMLYIT